MNVFSIALDTLIKQIRELQKKRQTVSPPYGSWNRIVVGRVKKIEPPSLEEKCKALAQIYVNNVNEDKLILEVHHLDILKHAKLFSPKEYLTSMKLLNGIY